MKALLIALIVIILLIFGYNKYSDYQRFNSETIAYTIDDSIDLDYYDQEVLYNYHQAIEEHNSFIGSQWSINGIDVRNPEDDNEETQAAVKAFSKIKGKIAFYEAPLKLSKKAKDQGLSNEAIMSLKETGKSVQELKEEAAKAEKTRSLKELFTSTSNNELRIGSRGALVFELQKLLLQQGYEIPVDGVFQRATSDALMSYEASKSLYADGKLDMLTLEYLLN